MNGSRSVLFLAPSAFPMGGLATWLDYLVPGLEAAGWRVSVALLSGRWHSLPVYREQHPGLEVIAVDNPSGSREGRVRAILELLRREAAEVLVVVNVADAYEAVRRLRCAGARSPRTLSTMHAFESDYFEELKEVQDLVDGVAATNQLACRLAVSWSGVAEGRIHYAPCGVPIRPRARFEQNGPLRLLFAGRLHEASKRVKDLCAIAERLEATRVPFRLLVVGDGPDASTVRERLAASIASGAVVLRGPVSTEELERVVLPASDVLIHTSPRETGPLMIWEAMAQGVAVVSSRYLGSGLEGALEDGVNCLMFEVGDVEGAARQVARLVDPELRARLSEAGYRTVEQRYRRERSVALWREAIERVAAAPGLPPPAEPSEPEAAGRLDRWLGVGPAESVRRFLGRQYQHLDSGGEWPHSYGSGARESEFLARARALDRVERGPISRG